MAERQRCEICDRSFKDLDGLLAHNKSKHPQEEISNKKKALPIKKIRNWGIFILIFVGIISLIFSGVSSIKVLPPTTMSGHVEDSPSSHILREPMPISIQKHMLEHSDGTGRPGVIINYNCEDYSCEENLIENLESFAGKYDFVYVAPFKNMDAKIALTSLNKIEILEEYSEDNIDDFILFGRIK